MCSASWRTASKDHSGFCPTGLDCAAALVPGILAYKTASADTIYVAVDQGILVKTGADVLVSVRRAVGGADLTALHQMGDAAVRRGRLGGA